MKKCLQDRPYSKLILKYYQLNGYYIYYKCRRFFHVINIVMDSVILNQLNNIEKEANSEVNKSKRGRKKKPDTKINEGEENDTIDKKR